MAHFMIVRRVPADSLTFQVDPALVISAVVVFARGEVGPVWAVGHPSAHLTVETSHGAEIAPDTQAPRIPPELMRETFIELGPPVDADGIELREIRIGETPPGMIVTVPWDLALAEPGRKLTLFLMGSKTGFINFTV